MNGSEPSYHAKSSKVTACKFIAALLAVAFLGGKYLVGDNNSSNNNDTRSSNDAT